jgi:hypothetical protein
LYDGLGRFVFLHQQYATRHRDEENRIYHSREARKVTSCDYDDHHDQFDPEWMMATDACSKDPGARDDFLEEPSRKIIVDQGAG